MQHETHDQPEHGMKRKTIRKILRGKVNAWLKSIEDEAVRTLLAKNIIVTGGSIASMLQGEKVNDFDLYFRTKEATRAAARYYVGKLKVGANVQVNVTESPTGQIQVMCKSAGVVSETEAVPYQYFELGDPEGRGAQDYIEAALGTTGIPKAEESPEKPPYRPLFVTSNSITLANDIQLVLRFYGEPEEIHKNYDFVHCTNYWCSWDDNLMLNPEALESILAKDLRYQGSLYPLCSIIRTRKFVARGWRINAGQYLKMVMQLNDLDLLDVEVLREQLTGVDVAYFLELIKIVSEAKADGKCVDSTYIATLVDRIF